MQEDYHQQLKKWLENNTLINKDEISDKKQSKKIKEAPLLTKKIFPNYSIQADHEIDLHNYTIDEAIAKVEQELKTLSQAGYKKLRVIHGKSGSNIHTIGGQLHLHLKSRWKKWVQTYQYDIFNQGSTLIILK